MSLSFLDHLKHLHSADFRHDYIYDQHVIASLLNLFQSLLAAFDRVNAESGKLEDGPRHAEEILVVVRDQNSFFGLLENHLPALSHSLRHARSR